MITEDYVSFETAKLLKAKGFNEFCPTFYETDEPEPDNGPRYSKKLGWFLHNSYDYSDRYGKMIISAPTLQMAMKWLRKVHHILVVPDYIYECTDTSWVYKIYRLGENGKPERNAIIGTSYDSNGNPTQHTVGYRDYDVSKQEYTTRTEAVEEGIKYCLENLI